MVAVVIGDGKLAVVETAHGDDLIDAVEDIGQVGGIGRGARGIEFMLFFQKGFGDAFAVRRGMNPAFFVANGPHKNAGAAAVTAEQSFKLVHVFRAAVEQAGFVHHQHAQAVAGIQQFGCGRVVAGSIGIYAEVFEQLDAVVLQVIGQCAAHTGMILVAIDAQNFQFFAV